MTIKTIDTEKHRTGIVTSPIGRTIQGVIAGSTNSTLFIDKLGERLAFERIGTRLYNAVIAKFDAADVHAGGPTRAELENIRNEEHHHFAIVRNAMRQLGADPTVMTPGADLISVAGFGWMQAVTDPSTTLTQCLDVLLMAELADTEGWEILIQLADVLQLDEVAGELRAALAEQKQHVMRVRTWTTNAVLGPSGTAPTPPPTKIHCSTSCPCT